MRKIDDGQYVVAETRDAESHHQLLLLCCGLQAQKAQRQPSLGLGHGEYVNARDFTEFGAKLADRGSQAGGVAATGQ